MGIRAPYIYSIMRYWEIPFTKINFHQDSVKYGIDRKECKISVRFMPDWLDIGAVVDYIK